jgi:hypothetical protein
MCWATFFTNSSGHPAWGKEVAQEFVPQLKFRKQPPNRRIFAQSVAPHVCMYRIGLMPTERTDVITLPRRRGAVDIASASGTRRPGFESRHGIRVLGKHSSVVMYKMTWYALFVCCKEK